MDAKELFDTEWLIKFPDYNINAYTIKFHSDGTLTFSNGKTKYFWSLKANYVRLKCENGVTVYDGIIRDKNFSGTVSNYNSGISYRFQAVLTHKPENNSNSHSQSQSSQSNKTGINPSPSITKRSNWREFERILIENNISTLYHFTDIANLESIIKHGALFSWQYCQTHNISIPYAGGDELSHLLDRRHGLENYVRLSFTLNHPMMYIIQKSGRILNPVILTINPEVIFLNTTKFANKNAARNSVNIGSTFEDFKKIKFHIVKQRNHFDLSEDDKPYYQAEVLVYEKIPIEFITNINLHGNNGDDCKDINITYVD